MDGVQTPEGSGVAVKVTVLLFNKPGRGEYYRMQIDMPEDSMPKTAREFATRSYNAVRHCWPDAAVDKAAFVDKCAGGKRYVVEGCNDGWSVEWATDAQVKETTEVMGEYMNGRIDCGKFLDYMMTVQPSERREL